MQLLRNDFMGYVRPCWSFTNRYFLLGGQSEVLSKNFCNIQLRQIFLWKSKTLAIRLWSWLLKEDGIINNNHINMIYITLLMISRQVIRQYPCRCIKPNNLRQEFYSLCGKTPYRQISWSFEAGIFEVITIYRSDISEPLKKSKPESLDFETSRDLAVRRPSAKWPRGSFH